MAFSQFSFQLHGRQLDDPDPRLVERRHCLRPRAHASRRLHLEQHVARGIVPACSSASAPSFEETECPRCPAERAGVSPQACRIRGTHHELNNLCCSVLFSNFRSPISARQLCAAGPLSSGRRRRRVAGETVCGAGLPNKTGEQNEHRQQKKEGQQQQQGGGGGGGTLLLRLFGGLWRVVEVSQSALAAALLVSCALRIDR